MWDNKPIFRWGWCWGLAVVAPLSVCVNLPLAHAESPQPAPVTTATTPAEGVAPQAPIVDAATWREGTVLVDQVTLANGSIHRLRMDESTGAVEASVNGEVTLLTDAATLVQSTVDEALADGRSGRGKRQVSCRAFLQGTAVANQWLWRGAAGMAVVPQARLIAAGGGLATTAILHVGASFC